MRTLSSYLRYGLLLPLFVSLVAMLLLSSQPSTTAHAASSGTGGPSFGLEPVLYDPSNPVTRSYFVFDSHPGSNLQSRVRVTNSGAATGTVQLYPADATSGQNGGIVYLAQNDPRSNVGAWLTLDTQELTLAPRQSQVVSFTLNIPAKAQAGQHIGGIVAESVSSDSTNQTHTLTIRVQNLSIVAVQVNLPGKLC